MYYRVTFVIIQHMSSSDRLMCEL